MHLTLTPAQLRAIVADAVAEGVARALRPDRDPPRRRRAKQSAPDADADKRLAEEMRKRGLV